MATVIPPLRYGIDAHDRLIDLGGGWDAFALENEAPELVSKHVLGLPLRRFISDRTTAQLTLDLLKRARGGVTVEYPFRCDAPALRRFLRMTMTPREGGMVELSSCTEAVEPRAPVPLLVRSIPRTSELLKICAWCKKLPVAGEWLEIEAAVEALKLFDLTRLPGLTHGICPPCEQKLVG